MASIGYFLMGGGGGSATNSVLAEIASRYAVSAVHQGDEYATTVNMFFDMASLTVQSEIVHAPVDVADDTEIYSVENEHTMFYSGKPSTGFEMVKCVTADAGLEGLVDFAKQGAEESNAAASSIKSVNADGVTEYNLDPAVPFLQWAGSKNSLLIYYGSKIIKIDVAWVGQGDAAIPEPVIIHYPVGQSLEGEIQYQDFTVTNFDYGVAASSFASSAGAAAVFDKSTCTDGTRRRLEVDHQEYDMHAEISALHRKLSTGDDYMKRLDICCAGGRANDAELAAGKAPCNPPEKYGLTAGSVVIVENANFGWLLDPADSRCYISIAGTGDFMDIVHDLTAWSTDFETYRNKNNQPHTSQVHQGFLTHFNLIRQEMANVITNNKCTKVTFSGHSLGAAVAQIAGLHFSNLGYSIDLNLVAPPRAFKQSISNSYTQEVCHFLDPWCWYPYDETVYQYDEHNYFYPTGEAYLIKNVGDPVAMAPPEWMGYRHFEAIQGVCDASDVNGGCQEVGKNQNSNLWDSHTNFWDLNPLRHPFGNYYETFSDRKNMW
jgi:hypothetical protein